MESKAEAHYKAAGVILLYLPETEASATPEA